MTKLSSVLKVAAAGSSAIALAGCLQTVPVKPDAAASAPQDNAPRAMGTTQTAPAPAQVAAGTLKWNDEECTTKNLTIGAAKSAVAGSDNSCLQMVVTGTRIATPTTARAGTAAQAASTNRKDTQGTKNAAQAKAAPAATAPAVTVGPAPEGIILTARLSVPACGASSGNALQAATDAGKAVLGTLSGLLGNRASQAAGNAVGGGVAGNIAGRAAKDATASANTQANNKAAGAAAPLTDAAINCNKQLTELSNGKFKDGLDSFVKEWKAANVGYAPNIVLASELPAAQEAIFASVVKAVAPAPGRR